MTRTVSIKPSVAKVSAAALIVALLPWLEGGRAPLSLVLSTGALLLAALLLWRQPEIPRLGLRGAALPAWLLLGWAALSLLWSANRYETAGWILSLGLAIAAFRIAYSLGEERRWRRMIIVGYLASAAIFALYGLVSFLAGDNPRLVSSIYWANPAAAYLLPALILAAKRGAEAPRSWRWAGLALLLWAAFWLTDSRGAFLVLLALAAVFGLRYRPPRRFWAHLVLTAVAGYALSFGMMQLRSHGQDGAAGLPGARFAEVVEGESSSGSDRLWYLGSATQMFADRPLTGFGAGTYGAVHPLYQGRVVSASDHAHNLYVQTFAELGMVGAGLLLWLLLALLSGIARRLKAERGTAAAAAGAVGLLLLFGLDIGASYPALLALAAILAALSYCPPRIEGPERLTGAVPLLALGLLAAAGMMNAGRELADVARLHQDEGEHAEAAELYGRAASYPVSDPDWLGAKGINEYRLALSGGPAAEAYLERARRSAAEARRRDPYDAQHHQLLGRIHASERAWGPAERELREALRLDRYNHPQYALDLARVLRERGNMKGAEAAAREMLARYPPDVIENRMPDRAAMRSLVFLKMELAVILEAQEAKNEAESLRREASELAKRLPEGH